MATLTKRQQQRRDNFLAGKARSAHRLRQSLETSLVEDIHSSPSSSSSTSASMRSSCKRGCGSVLTSLKPSFEAAGQHTAKEHRKRVASYPVPKKQKTAHRNIRG